MASIFTSIDQKRAAKGILTPDDYHGAAAAYWFIAASVVVIAALILVFYKVEPQWQKKRTEDEETRMEMAEYDGKDVDREKEIEKDLESADPVLVLPEAGMATGAIVEMAHHHE